MRLACINIDLDALPHYAAIHGLPEDALPPGADGLVDGEGTRRFLELCDARGVKGTLFAVGRDVGPAGAKLLRDAAARGHEIGNHTYWHDYTLARKSAADIAADIARGADALERASGTRPVGFRAPGYTFTREMYAALVNQNYIYGSSVYPAAPYYLAKAAVLGAQRVFGRRSAAMLDDPRVLAAPTLPYRPDPAQPYREGSGAVVELPVTVEPVTRFPFIGTFVATLPAAAVDALYASIRRRDFLNLELHGVDLLDATDGAGDALARVQRDLRVPAREKIARLGRVLDRIRGDYEVVTLAAAAARFPATAR